MQVVLLILIKDGIKNKDYKLYFYKLIKPEDNIEFKILIDGSKLKADKVLTATDLKTMELALITLSQPIGNIAIQI